MINYLKNSRLLKSQIVLMTAMFVAILLLQCSSPTTPTKVDDIGTLTVSPASGFPGTILLVSGLTDFNSDTDTLSATIGGNIAPIIIGDSGQVLVSIPLFFDDSGFVTVPAETLDLVITRNGITLGEANNAVTVEALPLPTHKLEDLTSSLEIISAVLDTVISSFNSVPGVEEQYMRAFITALDSLIKSSDSLSLTSTVEEVNADSNLTYVTAVLDANGMIESLMSMAEQLQAISSTLTTTSSIVKNIPSNCSSSPAVISTLLTDQDLARRMQFYVIVKMFGTTVISQTGQTYAETVGLLAGVLGIGGVDVPYVTIVGAVLTLIDVVVNKIVVGTLPATIDTITVDFANNTIQPGDTTEASVYILTSNIPPYLTVNDLIGLALTANGLTGPPTAVQSFKEILKNTVNFFIGVMQATFAAYTAQHPELNLDPNVASLTPPMKWEAYIHDPNLVNCQSLTPSIVTGMNSSPNWQADDNNYGEGRVYVMPATGSQAMMLSLPSGFTYSGGAFGMDMTASETKSVWVKPELALQVDFANTITVGGANVLGLDAGYYDSQGNPHWEPNIDISLTVTDGAADVTNGVTDAQGHFSSIITIDSTADSVTVEVLAEGQFNSQADTIVVSFKEKDPIVYARLTYASYYCSYVQPNETIPLDITVFNPDSGQISNAQVNVWIDGGGTLSATSGLTDANGDWSTFFTTPSDMSNPINIHVEVDAGIGSIQEKIIQVNRLGGAPGTGPVFIWGEEYSLQVMSCAVNAYGGPNDDGGSSNSRIFATCDSGFTSSNALGLSASYGCQFGGGSVSTTMDLTGSNNQHTISWTAIGGASGFGEYGSSGMDASLSGAVLYRKPSGLTFPAGAILRVTVSWNDICNWRIENTNSNNIPGGQQTFDIVLPEGQTSLIIPIGFNAYGQGTSGSNSYTSRMGVIITTTMECINCGD